jgi:hypothetical protein
MKNKRFRLFLNLKFLLEPLWRLGSAGRKRKDLNGELICHMDFARNSYFVFFRLAWCDFVDRMAVIPKRTIH